LVDELEDVLVRAADSRLEARWADVLAANETLRQAIDPPRADLARVDLLRRIGRVDEARGVATALFFRAASGALRDVDPSDLLELLAAMGLEPDELERLGRALPGRDQAPTGGAGVGTPAPRDRTCVLFVGGNQVQQRYRAGIDEEIAARFGGLVTVEWFPTGWGANWMPDVNRIEGHYADAAAVVVMTFVRTMLGRRIRRTAGEAGLPWISCTGHGRGSLLRAIDRAVAVAAER
jgi:hypothetical protein